jgi:AcrR family transcriptional regulator
MYLDPVSPSEPASGLAASGLAAVGPVAAVPDRRTRRRQEGRDRVYRAAVELFVERGFDATTMEDIADRADVARATVFNYFQRKTAFLDQWSALRRQKALAAIQRRHLSDHALPEILGRYMIELARLSTHARTETVALMGAAIHTTNVLGNPALAHAMTGFIARAQTAGEVRADVEVELAGTLVATGYFAILSQWISAEPMPFDLESRLLELVDLICTGLIAAPEPDLEGGQRAAVDGELAAGQVSGVGGDQEGDEPGDVVGGPHSLERDAERGDRALEHRLGRGPGLVSDRGHPGVERLGPDQAGQDHVDADAVRARLPGESLAVGGEGRLGRGVGQRRGARHAGGVRAAATTFAPAAARRRTVAAPMPRVPPVTRTLARARPVFSSASAFTERQPSR